jgi:hypothetical protein
MRQSVNWSDYLDSKCYGGHYCHVGTAAPHTHTHQPVEGEFTLSLSRNGIHGHQFNRRLEFFALCYSQSLLLAD